MNYYSKTKWTTFSKLKTGQKSKLRNVFENNLSANIKLSKTQISKIT